METFLALSNLDFLMSLLNVIIIGVFVFFAMKKFSYLINVAIYAIVSTLSPILISLALNSILGQSVRIRLGAIFIVIFLFCIKGFPVIKIVEKISDYFSFDTILYFIIAFSIVDILVSWVFVFVLRLLF